MSFQIVGQRHRLERRPRQVAREQLVPQATEAAVEALAAEALDEHLEALQEPRQALFQSVGRTGRGGCPITSCASSPIPTAACSRNPARLPSLATVPTGR